MSALGQKRTFALHKVMSALPLIATAKADTQCHRPKYSSSGFWRQKSWYCKMKIDIIIVWCGREDSNLHIFRC
jgi:hypothetical protein